MSTPLERFEGICEDEQKLFLFKNEEYGNTIEQTGVLGACVELIGAVARFKKLVLRNPTHGRDVKDILIDILKDVHNYSNIALMMLYSDNWEGRD